MADENDSETTRFVGRKNFLEDLECRFTKVRVFGVYGLRAVGKSKCVGEFIERIQKQNALIHEHARKPTNGGPTSWKPIRAMTVNLRQHADLSSLHSSLCSLLGIVPERDAMKDKVWIKQITTTLSNRSDELFIVNFDNAEDIVEQHNEFLSLVLEVVRSCKNVKVFITSTTKVQFATISKSYYHTIELPPLLPSESAFLLRQIAPSVDFEDYIETIVKLSEGLPLLILMIGAELSESEGSVTPKEMVEMLTNFRLEALSQDFYPPDQRAGDVYRKFIERLCEIYQQRFAALGYIPGSFNTEEAKEILGHETDALTKQNTLIPIRRRHMLTYDSSTQRFDIQGILRECLQLYFTIKNLPEIRARFIKTFSRVMLEMGRKLSTRDYATVLFEFSLEQHNLYKLLTDVLYSTEENYHFYIEIATTCTTMIEKYMTGISDQFYEGCLKISDSFGRQADKASVYIAIGSLATNAKGNFPLGEENYRSAVRILQPIGKSLQLITVYMKLGWNLHNQGNSYEALVWMQKSLDMSGNEHEVISLGTLSAMGAVYTWIGNYEKAKACHETVLRRRKIIFGDEHANVAVTLNNLGIMYDQMGEHEQAVGYLEAGLAMKKKNISTVFATVWSVVNSLSNIANNRTGLRKFDDAKGYLDEAMDLMNKSDNPHKGALSLTYNSYGKMYRAMGDLKKASEMFGIAVDMRKEIMPDSIPYIWSVINLANVQKDRRKFSKAIFLVDDILKRKNIAFKKNPHNDFALKCLEIKADIYKQTDLKVLREKIQDDIEQELYRLRKVFEEQSRIDKVGDIEKQLEQLKLDRENENTTKKC